MSFPEFIIDLGFLLLETSKGLFDFLFEEYTILGTSYSVYEILFGGGLFLFLGYILVSFIIDILP